MTAPAGWYQDPAMVGYVRYWDGDQWSPHTALAQGWPNAQPTHEGGEEYGPKSVLHYVIPVGRSWQAVAAPYLGLASLVSLPVIGHLLGVGGIALGWVALRRAGSGGHGTVRAIVAIVLGAVGVLTSTLFLLSII